MPPPKIINKEGHTYVFVQEFSSHILYQEINAKYKTCFLKCDLGYKTRQIMDRKIHIDNHI